MFVFADNLSIYHHVRLPWTQYFNLKKHAVIYTFVVYIRIEARWLYKQALIRDMPFLFDLLRFQYINAISSS